MMGTRLTWVWVFLAVLLGSGGAAPAWAEAPFPCEVTSAQDSPPFTMELIPGSFRQMLFHAMDGKCLDNKITFKVPKVVMKQALGVAAFSSLKGLIIEPAKDIPQVELLVQYGSSPEEAAGCSAPSPFDDCLAYLPTSNVTIRNIKVTVDPTSKAAPLRGLCIGHDEDVASSPSNNRVVLQKNEFNGFEKGGIFISETSYGILMSQNTFHNSGPGIVIEPNLETISAPPMGGSNQALFAVVDSKGAIVEYHLRGLSQDATLDTVAPVVELYESDGKAGTAYIKDCIFAKEMIDGKWNIDCVIPKTITLPFNYAVTITRNMGTNPVSIDSMTSMFAVGTIPLDVAKVPSVTPSTPQAPVGPPKPPITPTNPPAYKEPTDIAGDLINPLSLKAESAAGGCSLIR